jgi:hypothetical protein
MILIRFMRIIHRYFAYYRHDDYMSSSWMEELRKRNKNSIIIS